ncbi:phage scaffolding protein [Macrococcus capreoli]|uniref:phage scaffolding protein n=1 Tax=Macrococcus capreoli TaxID=2982690 RepID=UPI003EE4CAEE
MRREFLRGLGVAEDLIDSIINQHHDSLREYREKAEEADNLRSQLETAQQEITARDEQITALKETAGDNEELLNKLKELEEKNAGYDEKFRAQQLNNEVLKLIAKDAINSDQVLKLIDKDAIELDDKGNFVGIEDVVTGFKTDNPHLFQEAKRRGRPAPKGEDNPHEVTKEDFIKMSYTDRAKLHSENPELFNSLVN